MVIPSKKQNSTHQDVSEIEPSTVVHTVHEVQLQEPPPKAPQEKTMLKREVTFNIPLGGVQKPSTLAEVLYFLQNDAAGQHGACVPGEK